MAAGGGDEVEVPPTLKALLAARLDQLDAGRAPGARARRGRGRGLPPRRRAGARPGGDAGDAAPGRARAPGADPSRHGAVRGRGRLPLPASADPRRRLRRPPEGLAGRAARALRRLAGADAATSWSSWTRSSATTSSRPPATSTSSDNPTRSWPSARASGSRPPAGARSGAATTRAAAGLLERALELTRPARLDVVLELDLAQARVPDSREGRSDRRRRRRAGAGGRRRDRRGARPSSRRLLPRPLRGRSGRSTSSSDSRERRCRCSSRPRDHAGLVHVWIALGFGVANCRGHFEDWAQAAEQALRHARLAGQRSSSLFGLARALILGPRPADEALRTLDAAPAGESAALGAASARPAARHARPLRGGLADCAARPASAWRELSGDDWVEAGDSARSPRSPATTRLRPCHLRRVLRHARSARRTRPTSRPTRRCSAARCARSAATTRRSRSRSSAANSATSKTSSRRRCGGRCRRSSTPTAANTPKRSDSPARRSRSRSGRTH